MATGVRVVNELPRLFEKVGKDQYIKNLKGDTSFSNITIEVTPKEAQDLVYILSTSPGSLFLTLRHPSDHTKKRNYLGYSTIDSVLNKVSRSTASEQAKFKTAPAPAPVQKRKVPEKKPKRKGPFVDI